PGSSAASTLAPTAPTRGAAAARTSASRQPGSTTASLLSSMTCVAPASSAWRTSRLWPPAKPRFSGTRSSDAPGAAAVTSAQAGDPVRLRRTKSHAGRVRAAATLARQASVSAFAPKWSTDTATRGTDALTALPSERTAPSPREAEVTRTRIVEPGPQRGRDGVLVRNDRLDVGPRDAERGIVPQDAALAPGAVLAGALVEHDGAVLEGERAVREARRHPDDLVVAVTQLDPAVIAEPGRLVPDVDHDVEERAAQAAHVLAHGRVPLEVQPAQDAAVRDRLDRLLEGRRDTSGPEVGLDPRLHEVATVVRKGLRREDQDAGHLLGRDLHCNLRTGDAIRSPRAESNSTASSARRHDPPGHRTPLTRSSHDSRHRRGRLPRLPRGPAAARQGRSRPRVRQALLRRRGPRRGARQDRARPGRRPDLRPGRAGGLRRGPASRRSVERPHRGVQPEGQRGDQHPGHRDRGEG